MATAQEMEKGIIVSKQNSLLIRYYTQCFFYILKNVCECACLYIYVCIFKYAMGFLDNLFYIK